MIKSQVDPVTGDTYSDFGVYNDDENYHLYDNINKDNILTKQYEV
jgi:hypothetical protein